MNAKNPGRTRIILLVSLIALALALGLWWHSRSSETTDDAFIERHVLYVKPRVQGVVVEVPVTDNQAVQSGDLLVRIDPAPFQAALDAAAAELAAAETRVLKARSEQAAFTAGLGAREQNALAGIEVARETLTRHRSELKTLDAEIAQAEREAARYQQLEAKQQVSRQLLENTRTQLQTLLSRRDALQASVNVAQAQIRAAETQTLVIQSEKQQTAVFEAGIKQAEAALSAAKAALKQAQLQLDWTEIRAPHAGVVSKIQSRVGAQVDPAAAMAILVYGAPWVVANFKETQIGGMQVGDKVRIEIDAYPGRTFTGHLDSFQAGTGSRFSLLPPENATGNFVKVVQRVPVKLVFDEVPQADIQLWPGMSVIPTVQLK